MKICEAGRDPCGCNNWAKGIRMINGQYPDDNRDFDINAGDGIEVTPATGGITIAMKAPVSGPMIYRGTVGTGGTVATLPDANVENSGWVYVAITAGSTPDDTPVSYNVGDMIISNGQEWTVVPAGDDPYVTLDTAQTITGEKTFTTAPISQGTGASMKLKSTDQTQASPPSTNRFMGYSVLGSDNTNLGTFTVVSRANGNREAYMQAYASSGSDKVLRLLSLANGTGYVTAPSRSYNAANVDDVVTIGSLASNPSVLHSTGEQSQLASTLLFNSWGSRPKPPVNAQFTGTIPPANDQTVWLIGCYDSTDAELGRLYIRALSNGTTQLRINLRNSDGTAKVVVLAQGDVI